MQLLMSGFLFFHRPSISFSVGPGGDLKTYPKAAPCICEQSAPESLVCVGGLGFSQGAVRLEERPLGYG